MADDPSYDPLRPHVHEPNPTPPNQDSSFDLILPNNYRLRSDASLLHTLKRSSVPGCYIVSTGHGTSGPFEFEGVALIDYLMNQLKSFDSLSSVEVLSADGFGTRITIDELNNPSSLGLVLLADTVNGRPLTRNEGLVRLIVPGEMVDALRQVKWIAHIIVRGYG
jgi:hypothetical protein